MNRENSFSNAPFGGLCTTRCVCVCYCIDSWVNITAWPWGMYLGQSETLKSWSRDLVKHEYATAGT